MAIVRRTIVKGSTCGEEKRFSLLTNASSARTPTRSADQLSVCFGFEAWLLFGFEAQNNNNNNNNNKVVRREQDHRRRQQEELVIVCRRRAQRGQEVRRGLRASMPIS